MLYAFLVAAALSQTQPNVRVEPDKEVARAKTIVDFNGAVLEGNRTGPASTYLTVPRRDGFKCRIQLRTSMQDKLEGSEDNL